MKCSTVIKTAGELKVNDTIFLIGRDGILTCGRITKIVGTPADYEMSLEINHGYDLLYTFPKTLVVVAHTSE